jgi:hypothetical protein
MGEDSNGMKLGDVFVGGGCGGYGGWGGWMLVCGGSCTYLVAEE